MSNNPHTSSNRGGPNDTDVKTTEQSKSENLEKYRSDAEGHDLRTNHGTRIADNHNSLKAGERGPTLMEDFVFREKLNHFDNERIPERIVHARGAAAHGYFQPYAEAAQYSKAGLFQDPDKKTPVFVRFSTVQGSRGSNDTVRDVRGFATKFYTDEGNWDLVGNDMPVFFIQDAIKFPDFVHAVKPEPHNEIPQGQSAHDTFWDFVSLMPESSHMVLWTMSDRAFPRHYRNMEGFGVHTFRLVDKQGKSRFVKFHWKPLAGTCSLIWDEAQKLWGRDPDFNRRNMWDDIENGNFLEFEFGIQVVEEEDEHKFDFDILDPTKLIPEEQVPVTPIGKMVLNRNRTTTSPRPSRWPSTRPISCRGSTSPTTRCCRAGCSPISIRRCCAWAGPTSTRSRSTSRYARSTITSATPCTARRSTRDRPPTSPIRSTAAGPRRRRPRRKTAGSRQSTSESTPTRFARAAHRSATTTPRRHCSGTARPMSRRNTSSLPTPSSYPRCSAHGSASG
jgi:hypothetical protein